MRSILCLLSCCFILLCFPVVASKLPALYTLFEQQRDQLTRLLESKPQQSAKQLSAVTVDYIRGQGAQFRIFFAPPPDDYVDTTALTLTDESAAKTSNSTQITEQFNRIKQSARALSHQIYSLERQISSMQQSQTTDSAPEQQALQVRIAKTKQQLALLQTQKKQLEPQYEQLQKQLEEDSYQPSNIDDSPLNSIDMLNIASLLCHAESLLTQLPMSESIAFIFYHTGPQVDGRYQSNIYNFPNNTITACQHGEINEQQLLEHAITDYF